MPPPARLVPKVASLAGGGALVPPPYRLPRGLPLWWQWLLLLVVVVVMVVVVLLLWLLLWLYLLMP